MKEYLTAKGKIDINSKLIIDFIKNWISIVGYLEIV